MADEDFWGERRADFVSRFRGRRLIGCPASADASALAALPDPASPSADQGRAWSIPASSPYFSGRQSEIQALRTALSREQRAAISPVQAVCGLGGIGKTRLALVYAREYRAEYAAGYFVRADPEVAFQQGLSEVGRQLGWPSGLKPEERLQAARWWLESSPDVLLIPDHADSMARVKPLCSAGTQAHVLVTTRAWSCGAIGVRQPVRLQKMSAAEAVLVMQERTGNHDEAETLSQIVEELDGLPLALEQAGAYIAEREMRYSDYLAAYRHRRTTLLRERPEHGDYPASVATTWSPNSEEARKHSPGSAALMKLAASLAPDAIPEELLLAGSSQLGEELATLKEPGGLDDRLAPLLHYSLITRDREGRTLSLHRLLQAMTLDGLTATDQAGWQECLIRSLYQVIPEPEHPMWSACARLVAHAQAVLQRNRQEEQCRIGAGILLLRVGE